MGNVAAWLDVVGGFGAAHLADTAQVRHLRVMNLACASLTLVAAPYAIAFWMHDASALAALILLLLVYFSGLIALNGRGHFLAARLVFLGMGPVIVGLFAVLLGPQAGVQDFVYFGCGLPFLICALHEWRTISFGVTAYAGGFLATEASGYPLGWRQMSASSAEAIGLWMAPSTILLTTLLVAYFARAARSAEGRLEAQVEARTSELREEIARRERAEHDVQRAAKLEAVGQLAGGVAHDFNNLLSMISGACEMLRMDLAAGTPAREDVEQILATATRGRDLTRQLLDFARVEAVRPRIVDVHEVVADLKRLLGRTFDRRIRVETELAAADPVVLADPTLLHSALLNLSLNARDAMLGVGDGGAITIATHDEPEGDGLRIEVRDDGPGIAPDLLDNIFDPFFTTKELGAGTGLGLAAVHGFVTGAGGQVRVESVLGCGATFQIRLPRCPAERRSRETPEPRAPGVAVA